VTQLVQLEQRNATLCARFQNFLAEALPPVPSRKDLHGLRIPVSGILERSTNCATSKYAVAHHTWIQQNIAGQNQLLTDMIRKYSPTRDDLFEQF